MSAFINPERMAVHPLVTLSVLDHYKRAKSTNLGSRRIVGALLGTWSGHTVRITNSFAVPFAEDPTDPLVWFLDHDYMEAMRELHKKVAARERIVGWYHSGPGVWDSDAVIHRILFGENGAISGGDTPTVPLMVVFNPMQGSFDGYYLQAEDSSSAGPLPHQQPQRPQQNKQQFVHIQGEVEAEEAEEVGVEHLLRDIGNTSAGSLSLGLSLKLKDLLSMRDGLDEIIGYLDQAVAGTIPINQSTLSSLQRAVMSAGSATSTDGLSKAATDQSMLIYLGHLSKSVLVLHDLIENKEQQQLQMSA